MFRRVLVMLDDTPAAARILPWVRRLVAPVGGDVRLLTVLPPARALVADARTVAYADQREDAARLAALLSLETLATVLRDDGLVATSEVRFGDPPSAALDAVREWGAELLAVADGPRRGGGACSRAWPTRSSGARGCRSSPCWGRAPGRVRKEPP